MDKKKSRMANAADDPRTLRSIFGRVFSNFETIDARVASALKKKMQKSNFKKKVHVEEQKAQKEDRFLRGSQIAFMIYE